MKTVLPPAWHTTQSCRKT